MAKPVASNLQTQNLILSNCSDSDIIILIAIPKTDLFVVSYDDIAIVLFITDYLRGYLYLRFRLIICYQPHLDHRWKAVTLTCDSAVLVHL